MVRTVGTASKIVSGECAAAVCLSILVSITICWPTPGAAQWDSENDAIICMDGSGRFDLDVAVCTRAIRSQRYSQATLATLHVARARAHRQVGNRKRALEDLDAAIALNPQSAAAFQERGLINHEQGDGLRAIADFTRATVLFPRFAQAYRARGVSWLHHGDLERALADLDHAIAIDANAPEGYALRGFVRYALESFADAERDFLMLDDLAYPYPYTALWVYLARTAWGLDASRTLRRHRDEFSADEWPRPLIDYCLGDKDEQALHASIAQSPPGVRERRMIETHYYVGELLLLQGRRDAARERFREIADITRSAPVEVAVARARLAHL